MSKRQSKEEHEKTCFRCRIHALIEELYPNGMHDKREAHFILIALAEAAGQLLADFEEQDFHHFISAVAKFHNDQVEEDFRQTKH